MMDVSPPQPPASSDVTPEKPAKPSEPPFAVDDLISCTSRFTHTAWYLFYEHQKDMDFIRKTHVQASLEARSADGADAIRKILTEAGIGTMDQQDKTLLFTATFEVIQKVIRHPQTLWLDVITR